MWTVRSRDGARITNAAITDLLPGGFEIVQGGTAGTGCDYVDVREDRAVFYGNVDPAARTISYKIKATNRGEFVVPPPYAESMYDREIQARGLASKIKVVDTR